MHSSIQHLTRGTHCNNAVSSSHPTLTTPTKRNSVFSCQKIQLQINSTEEPKPHLYMNNTHETFQNKTNKKTTPHTKLCSTYQ